jgi:hypothetical protein
MIRLNTTAERLVIGTSAADSVTYTATYKRIVKGEAIFKSDNGVITALGDTDVINNNTPAVFIDVDCLSIVNTGAAPNTVQIKKESTTTEFPIFSLSLILAVGESVVYSTAAGWQYFTASGKLKLDGAGGGGGDAVKADGLVQFTGNGTWKVWYSDGSGNTVELALGASGYVLQSNGASAAPTFVAPSGGGDMTIAVYDPAGIAEQLVGLIAAQTLTNKTLTAPIINSPTGIVKGDVGLGNVDNTSDATKDAATATLTNKTIEAGIFTTSMNGNYLTASEIVITDASKNIVSAPVATYPSLAELAFLKGVTSAIQAQINAKGVGDAIIANGLDQFTGNGTWKVFYSDGSGNTIELALGGAGTVLQSNGAALPPSFATPAGGGDVSKVGTPVDNQVGVWTGDGTIEGTTGLTYDGTNFNITGNITLSGTVDGIDIFVDVTANNAKISFDATSSSKLAGIEALADVTDAVNVGSSINGATAKTTPVDADTMPLIDSAAANVLKKVTWANIKSVIATSYNSLTATMTNKRITPRVGSTTSSATPTINTNNVDFYHLTAQAVAITSFTTNLSGTPTNNQKLWIAITGTAARAITWGASFEDGAVTLPTTTITTQRLDVGFIWNSVTSKWRCMAAGPLT